jgi:hypothetical protein
MADHASLTRIQPRDARSWWRVSRRVLLAACVFDIAYGTLALGYVIVEHVVSHEFEPIVWDEWFGGVVAVLAGTFGLRVVNQLRQLERAGAAA